MKIRMKANVTNKNLNTLSALTAQGIGVWNYDTGSQTLSFLDNYTQALGLNSVGISHEERSGFETYVHPEDLPNLYEALQKALSADGEVVQVKYRCTGMQGGSIWLEDAIVASREVDRQLIGYSRNIQHQVTIRTLDNRFNKFLQASTGFIFIFDDQFFFRDVFLSEGENLLHSLKDLIGLDARNIFSPEVCELYTTHIHGCLKDGQLHEIEYPLDMNGVRYFFQARIVPYEDNQVMALIYDIGDRVKRIKELLDAKKKAEEADRMKSAFLANMSHEIRTPLNAIVGFSEIIAAEEEAENREEYVEIIRTNSNLLLQLINDILDISRMEAGKSEINLKEIDVCALVYEISQVHRVKMKPGVELITTRPKGKLWTLTDPNRVKQIVYNFLSNAIKNTEKGSITLQLDVPDNETLRLTVIDTGRGIEEDKLNTVFNRFEKLNSFAQGTGLGLAISKSLSEHLGGSVNVTSVFGTGSAFSLSLPIRQSTEQPKPAPRKIETSEKRSKRLLVVEPADTDYSLISVAIEGTYDLVRAATAKEAIHHFSSERFDLVLMNIPAEADETVEVLKQMHQHSPATPLIAVVEHGHYTERHEALEAGCIDVVTKPYSTSSLREAIIAHL